MSLSAPTPIQTTDPLRWVRVLAAAALLLALLVWSYWATLNELWAFWHTNDDYSSGMLVPLVAIPLAWRALRDGRAFSIAPSAWGGAVIVLGLLLRLAGAYFDYGSAERYSMLVSVAGLVLLIGGWTTLRRVGWVLVFLLLMVPLPRRLHELISLPLQGWATFLAALGLELFGYFVVREGNVLMIEQTVAVAVAEACNGIRLLTAFVLVASVAAFLANRPLWHKAAIVIAGVPIAVVANALRLTATSMYIVSNDDPGAEQQFHDLAGLAMMPLAVGLLAAFSWLLGKLVPSGQQSSKRSKPPVRVSSSRPKRFRSFMGATTIAICLLVSGGIAYRMVAQRLTSVSAVRITLDPPLATLAYRIGAWSATDIELPEGLVGAQRNDEYICRSYADTSSGETVLLYVAYTARPRTMLGHRPEVCYTGVGWIRQSSINSSFTSGGLRIPCRRHRFERPAPRADRHVVLNYYVLGGVLTRNETDFRALRWRHPNIRRDPGNYVAQVQIIVRVGLDIELAERTAERFAQESAAALLALLPEAPTPAP